MSPTAPLEACHYPRCAGRANAGRRYCATHDTAKAKRVIGTGGASTKAYDRAWKRLRLMFLAEHPLCGRCELEGRVTAASVVDHIEPVATHPELRLCWDNLRSFCAPCHNSHTASTRGYGRAR